MPTEETIRMKFEALRPSMNERMRRLWAGTEAKAMERGGIAAVSRATGLAISTVRKGLAEVLAGASPDDVVNVRRPGAGRRKHGETHPELVPALRALVDPATRGDPESPLRWSAKSAVVLAAELSASVAEVSDKTVARLLREEGYSIQAAKKTVEGSQHPDRDAQFEFINSMAKQCIVDGTPFISVDTKKKELVGNFKNAGAEWQPKGQPEMVDVHDFPDDAIGKAIPYGVYDVGDNSGFVNVGVDHDTPVFAVTSIRFWWKKIGQKRYPKATELFISGDAGGSNGYRSRVLKVEMQRLANETGLSIHMSHFPPGTSKWNNFEHRLFSFITLNWRGRPLRTYETVVNLTSNTTNRGGLVVKAHLDRKNYPTGKTATDAALAALNIERATFHGDWNYTIHPQKSDA